MTFLSPTAGIVGAAIAVPLLIALYFLKLRRKPLRVSSTLLWEQVVQDLQANVPLRWLRASWVLVLQLLALVMLLGALARPAIPAEATVAARTVIIIDRSASMSAKDGVQDGAIGAIDAPEPFTRLEQARAEARRIIEDLRRSSAGPGGRRPEAMIVGLAREARVLAPFTSDLPTLREAIDLATATDQPGELGAALDLTRAMSIGLDGEVEKTQRTRVLLISDGGLDASGVREGLPSGMDFALVPVGPVRVAPGTEAPAGVAQGDFDNLAIGAVAARRDLDDPAVVRVFVRVENAGLAEVEAGVSLRVNDEPAGVRTVRVPAPRGGTGAGGELTGQASATFEITRSEAGLIVVSIARADRLEADDTAALVLRGSRPPRVVMVGPGIEGDALGAARGEHGIDRFLLGLFEELDVAGVRRMNAAEYARLASAGGVAADLVVFDRVTPAEMPGVPTISIGAGLPDGSVRVSAAEGERATRFVLWRREHPLLRSVPLDAVLISPPMRMEIEEKTDAGGAGAEGGTLRAGAGETAAAGASAGGSEVEAIAYGTSGPLMALRTGPGGSGVKRLVLGFDLLRTNWGPDVSFPVFFGGAVEFLTGRGEAAAASGRSTSETIGVLAEPGATELRVSGPMERVVPILGARGGDGEAQSVTIGTLERAGVYRVEGAAGADRVVAVNLLDSRESAIQTRRSIRLGSTGARIEARSTGGEPARKEIWHWLVIAAAGLLVVEGLVFARQMRA